MYHLISSLLNLYVFRETDKADFEMPNIKQPSSLKKMAFHSLVKHVVSYCDKLSVPGSLTKLRRGIILVKEQVRNHLSGILFAKFCRGFLNRFYRLGTRPLDERPASHYKAALEIAMDIEIVGLRFEGCTVRYLDPRDALRIHRLDSLDWSEFQFCETKPRGLENFRFQNLTTFVFPRLCTDEDLLIVGRRCLKLQILMIQESSKVTDRGLRGLKSCSELRVVCLHNCRVSDDGMNELLSMHEKLEEFNMPKYYSNGDKSFDVTSRSSSMTCPSIKRVCIQSTPVTNEHLQSVVELFPNLTHLRVCCQLMGDLCKLKDLEKLTELNFSCGYRCFRTENLKQLVKIVGGRLTTLNMLHCNPRVYLTQEDLNFLLEFCCNLQCLRFDYGPVQTMDRLVIPQFQKLKELECSTLLQYSGCHVDLEFGNMPALENLKIDGFQVTMEAMKLLMLDNVRFPKLKVLIIPYASEECVNRLMEIAVQKNLDFVLKNSFSDRKI